MFEDESSRMSQTSIQLQNIRSLPPGRANKDRSCISWENNESTLYGNIPNRHENLFTFGRRGIALSKVIMQSIYLLSLLCISS